MNRILAEELKTVLINYESMMDFVEREMKGNINKQEEKIFLTLVDEYEILIFNLTKNFLENFSMNDAGE